MDLVEFRVAHPGLYQEAFDAGAEAEAERQKRVRVIATSVGGSPDRAVEQGWTPAQTADHFRQFAGRSDESAAAFTRAVRSALTTSPRSDDDLDIDALVARLHGAPPAPPGNVPRAPVRGVSVIRDLGDLMAEDLPPPRAARANALAPGARSVDDLFAQALQPAAGTSDRGGAR